MWRSKPYPRKSANRRARSISRQSAHRATLAVLATVMITNGHAAAETSETKGYNAEATAENATVSAEIEQFINRLSDEIQRDTERSVLNSLQGRWRLESLQTTRQVVVVQAQRSNGSTNILVKSVQQPLAVEGPAPPPAALANERFSP
ncbi:MAG: hypothetical protein CBC48_15915 [bacterium TMED88]|nr:hypothetical protein [Deltaproteobacteria bacterium]OUV25869.1 MAG: hypothetical protein CBC48_15915 [bacterium TMED88]